VAAGVNRAGGQRGGEVARGHLKRSVADGEPAIADLDRLACVWFACLANVDAVVMRERLIDDTPLAALITATGANIFSASAADTVDRAQGTDAVA
jgi:hypothetical protein